MKTFEELQELSVNIAKATFAYHMAVETNLKESGKEYNVTNDDYEKGLPVKRLGVVDVVIDKVRYNNDAEDGEEVEAHVCEEDGCDSDDWLDISYFEKDETYIYDNIEWDD